MSDELVGARLWKIMCYTNKKVFNPVQPSYSNLYTSGRISGTVWKLTSESVISNAKYCAMTLIKDSTGNLQVMIRYLKESNVLTASGFSVVGTWIENKSSFKESDPIYFDPTFAPPSSPLSLNGKPSEKELDAIAELVLATLAYAQQIAFSELSEVVAFPEGLEEQVSELKDTMLQNSFQLWWTIASPRGELQKRYEFFQSELKCAPLYEQSYREIQTLEQEVSSVRQKETDKSLRLLNLITGTFAVIQGVNFIRGLRLDVFGFVSATIVVIFIVWGFIAFGIFRRGGKRRRRT